EIVLGEPTLVLLAVKNDSPRRFSIPGSVVSGVWQRRRADGGWEDCRATNPLFRLPAPSRESFQTSPEFQPGETRVLGVAFPGACDTIQGENLERRRSIRSPPWDYQVRFNADPACCHPSEALEIRVVPGSPADARARTAERNFSEHPDSILAGWQYLSWE